MIFLHALFCSFDHGPLHLAFILLTPILKIISVISNTFDFYRQYLCGAVCVYIPINFYCFFKHGIIAVLSEV